MFIALTILFFAFAAIFKAVSDTVADKYSTSIFTRYNNPMFWDKSVSWQRKYRQGWQYWDPISDAWHLSNGAMISSFIAAGICLWLSDIPQTWYYAAGVFSVIGVWVTVVFNTFYNHVLKNKK